MTDPVVVGPYSPSRRVGAWVVTSGQLGVRPGDDGAARLVEGGPAAELRQALANLAGVLEAAGADLGGVVKATLFVTDLSAMATLNGIWADTFTGTRPTRSVVGVAGLPMGATVEVEAWALADR